MEWWRLKLRKNGRLPTERLVIKNWKFELVNKKYIFISSIYFWSLIMDLIFTIAVVGGSLIGALAFMLVGAGLAYFALNSISVKTFKRAYLYGFEKMKENGQIGSFQKVVLIIFTVVLLSNYIRKVTDDAFDETKNFPNNY